MRYVLILALALFVASLQPARAAPDDITPTEYQDMQKIYADCSGSLQNLYYDCQCVSIKHMDLVRNFERDLRTRDLDGLGQALLREKKRSELLIRSYDGCTDTNDVAMLAYDRCVGWAMTARDDYKDFCGCYGVKYADTFALDGNRPFFDDTKARTDAMTSCNQNYGGNLIPDASKQITEPSAFDNFVP